MDFMAAHELIDDLEDSMKEKYHCAVSIHMDPVADHDSEVKAKISKRLTEFDGRYNAVINVDKGDTL